MARDFLQPSRIRNTLHAYQLAKRCNKKRTMYEAIRWGEHAQFITGSTFLVDGGADVSVAE